MMAGSDYDSWSKKDLLGLSHNDHKSSFYAYFNKEPFAMNKHRFLFKWVKPKKKDFILECGSSGGKTCIDFAKRSGCRALGVDFDPLAIKVSNKMMRKYFPNLDKRCTFVEGDLETMHFNSSITKVVMADFTEHIPDRVFRNILINIKKQLPDVTLYIYTPLRTHLFEIMKHRNIILKNTTGHINVKTKQQLIDFLESNQWKILDIKLLPSSIHIYGDIEKLLIKIPIIGSLFSRRIAIITKPLRKKELAQ